MKCKHKNIEIKAIGEFTYKERMPKDYHIQDIIIRCLDCGIVASRNFDNELFKELYLLLENRVKQ